MSSSNNYRSFLALVAAATALSTTSAFPGVAVGRSSRQVQQQQQYQLRPLRALIYGWDGDDDDVVTDTDNLPDFLKHDTNVDFGESCSPVGTAVAEKLSYDPENAAHLARLAVAFSPADRALNIKDIEQVNVVCVREDSIEIQAVICGNDSGCVSLAVPVKYPRTCQSESNDNLEGCVLQNLSELNQQAESTLNVVSQQQQQTPQDAASVEDLYNLNNAPIEQYPEWWVTPDLNDRMMVDECDYVKNILNEPEFAPDVLALAQDAMKTVQDHESYQLQKVRCAVVGPAGIAFKAIAQCQTRNASVVLDVMYPFGGQPQTDANSLRAAVLGAVAAAEGE